MLSNTAHLFLDIDAIQASTVPSHKRLNYGMYLDVLKEKMNVRSATIYGPEQITNASFIKKLEEAGYVVKFSRYYRYQMMVDATIAINVGCVVVLGSADLTLTPLVNLAKERMTEIYFYSRRVPKNFNCPVLPLSEDMFYANERTPNSQKPEQLVMLADKPGDMPL